jgi:hypothetical protein
MERLLALRTPVKTRWTCYIRTQIAYAQDIYTACYGIRTAWGTHCQCAVEVLLAVRYVYSVQVERSILDRGMHGTLGQLCIYGCLS